MIQESATRGNLKIAVIVGQSGSVITAKSAHGAAHTSPRRLCHLARAGFFVGPSTQKSFYFFPVLLSLHPLAPWQFRRLQGNHYQLPKTLLSLCAVSWMWFRHRSFVIVPPEGGLEFSAGLTKKIVFYSCHD